MVVPLGQDRDLRIEGPDVCIKQVVPVIAPELAQRLGDPGFFLGDDVAPDLAVRQDLPVGDGAIGIDAIAGMDEKIRTRPQHGRIGAHAAPPDVDPPALARGIAGPDERDIPPVGGRRAEMSDLRFADECRECEVLKGDAIKDILARRQVFQQQLGSAIGLGQRIDEVRASNGPEAVRRRDLDQHAGGPVGARPDDACINRHVTGLDAMGDDGPVRCPAEIGPREGAARERCGRRCGTDQDAPPCHRLADARRNGHPVFTANHDGSCRRRLTADRHPCEDLMTRMRRARNNIRRRA